MKLVIVGPAHPLRGGIAHHVYSLTQELRSRGHQVLIISYRRLYPRIFFPGTTPFDSSHLKLDPGATAVLDSMNPLTWRRTFRVAQSSSPDAVLIQWWHPFFSLLVGSLGRMLQKAGLKSILECHNVFPHERAPWDPPLLRFAFSPFSSFITHSSADREDLLKLMPGRTVRVAPLPVLKEFSSQGDRPGGSRTVLFFGMVRKYKGLDILLRAMPKVLSKVDCELLIAGEFYEPVAKYQRLIRDLGVEHNVRIDNRYIPNEEVAELFRYARILVMPYLSATQSGIAQIAFANGLPVIASRTGGLAEVVVEGVNGWLVPPGDVDALAAALVSYLSMEAAPGLSLDLQTSAGNNTPEDIEKVIQDLVRLE
ncbi:MAG: glycosyltransferase family 4 protein [Acidobacteriia bacterium]|nr:glycosyltransferase family 4 protein [Terriglobia bacterium]